MTFKERLNLAGVIICDGAMGTMLQSMGLPADKPPELWNLEEPELVQEVHKGYVEAGVDIIQTNTFGANRIKLTHYKLDGYVKEINRQAVELAKEVAGGKVYVAASVGPTGKFLPPLGNLKNADEVFGEQIYAQAEAGADIIILETFSDLQELLIALRVAKTCGLPVISTMTFDTNRRTMMGVSPRQAVEELTEVGADIIGANCGIGPDAMEPVIAEFCRLSNLPVIAQPNAGLPKISGDKVVYEATPELMAEYSQKYKSFGVKIIGACCGSTPQHLRAIVEALRG